MLTLDEEVTSVTEAEAYRYTSDDLRRKLRTPSRPSSNATRTQLHTVTAEKRHTYASLARASGADLRYVQKTMGHSTPTVTANIYSDLYSDELDQVATNLDRLHASDATPANGQEPDTLKHS
jgi:integrase